MKLTPASHCEPNHFYCFQRGLKCTATIHLKVFQSRYLTARMAGDLPLQFLTSKAVSRRLRHSSMSHVFLKSAD